MRVRIIANPISGRGNALKRAEWLRDYLVESGVPCDVSSTNARGDAIQLTRACAGEVDAIVCAGGDGTLNEIVNGLPREGPRPPIALLPCGTANLLALELDVPKPLPEFAELIASGRTREIDLMRVNDRLSFLMVGVGFDSAVLHGLERSGPISKMTYFWPSLKALWRYRMPRLTLTRSGGERVSATQVIATNVSALGSKELRFGNRARLDDGAVETYWTRGQRRLSLMRYVIRMLLDTFSRADDVSFERLPKLSIHAESPVPYQIDGDFAGFTPVSIEVLPRALSVFAGRGSV